MKMESLNRIRDFEGDASLRDEKLNQSRPARAESSVQESVLGVQRTSRISLEQQIRVLSRQRPHIPLPVILEIRISWSDPGNTNGERKAPEAAGGGDRRTGDTCLL